MDKTLTLTQIVREVPEPHRTRFLRGLQESGQAVTIIYTPRDGCPSSRRHAYTVEYGSPPQRVRFEAGKPKAVSVGLAVKILHNLRRPAGGGDTALRWEDDEWTEQSDGFAVAAMPDSRVSRIQERERASQPVEPSDDLPSRPAVPEDDVDLGGPGEDTGRGSTQETEGKYLSEMTRSELAEVHEAEVGPIPSDAKKRDLYEAIREHREGAGGETEPAQ